jgi:hypothetical protein
MYEVCKDVADPYWHGLLGWRQFASILHNQPVAQADDCVEGAVENEVWQERHATNARCGAGQSIGQPVDRHRQQQDMQQLYNVDGNP